MTNMAAIDQHLRYVIIFSYINLNLSLKASTCLMKLESTY